MILLYDDREHYLYALRVEGYGAHYMGSWPAYNNVDSRSKGIWPAGVFTLTALVEVAGPDSELDGAFGPHFLRFGEVEGREGMGIHAGRSNIPDGAGRRGPQHATMGCIRTWAQSLKEIVEMHRRRSPIDRLVVVR